jgi:hypothetical protein
MYKIEVMGNKCEIIIKDIKNRKLRLLFIKDQL